MDNHLPRSESVMTEQVTRSLFEWSSAKLTLNLRREIDESYDIVFGEYLFPEIANYLKRSELANMYAIITDFNVRDLYASDLEHSLRGVGLKVNTFSFPPGEQNKTMDNCIKIIEEMSKSSYGCDSAILALGGGVVGDMAGLISALYNRGIPYVQIPTTLLAQADSAIGGITVTIMILFTPKIKIGEIYNG